MTAPILVFHDLVLDTLDPQVSARFWGGVFGMRVTRDVRGFTCLVGDHAWERLWLRPAPTSTESAVRVDVELDRPSRLFELGARLEDGSSYPWLVARGPEGSEICAFPLSAGGHRGLLDLVMDSPDPHEAAQWWAQVLGTGYHADDDYAWVEPVPGAPFASLVFARADAPPHEARQLRPCFATVDPGALFAMGAQRIASDDTEMLLAAPGGNEFFLHLSRPVVRADDEG